MKLNVYRDENGVVQNIGDWDYKKHIDPDGVEVVNNPLPDGYTVKKEEVITNEDGSISVVAKEG